MKIRSWLLSSYLVAMILPIVLLYLLIHLVQSYDQEKEMLDYLDVQAKLDHYQDFLANSRLYKEIDNKREYSRLDDYSQKKVIFTLYDKEGFILYSTGSETNTLFKEKQEYLYQNLYEINPTYTTFEYKSPVFENGKLIGFYKISFLRLEWVDGVDKRKNLSIFLYITSFLLIYFLIIFLLQRKLFQPLIALMYQMTQFAKDGKVNILPKKKDEIGELITHFEMMQSELEDKSRSLLLSQEQKQYMIASISHDLKTPLTAIRTSVEGLIEEKQLNAQQRDRLNMIVEKSDYIRHLIDDLTMYSILQSNQYEIETVLVDGQEFFEMLLSDYDQLAYSFQVCLLTHVDVHGTYSINQKQLLRLCDNLVMNALHHTEVGKKIWLSAFSTNNQIPDFVFSEAKQYLQKQGVIHSGTWLIFQNEGQTISSKDQEKLFEPLFQGDPSRNKETKLGNRGSGLGLSIAQMIIEKLGGFILVRSTQGCGTTFICFLPEMSED
ncbi:HAMP domain-containing sensor histidine kinase [Bacillus sp. 31A1R]|uniref:histidine kinase n=1 Tax=Robertmurraya mangrovi TaxID=3098077 RepID=A0ABU5IY65_9BACI|nr:HAMP domain-containing sensor histidine kinase [Bacillus sp. 31A1R]MDZ5472076.1 HAMP domain-containing sensor histidine kinase [Bacillus sp. 31A1R]